MIETPRAPGRLGSESPPGRALTLGIFGLFLLSGSCALVYEVAWMRMLTLIFGATAFATSTILASFFAGLALGGWWFGRIADRGRDPLLIYALLEAGIGAFAFVMPLLLSAVTWVYVAISREIGFGFYAINLIRFVLAFGVLVLPATLMGGTLPVLVKYFTRTRAGMGRQVALLYALNTLGAVIGAMSAGFLLILLLGTREAAYAAGILNLVIAGLVLVLRRARRPAEVDLAEAGIETSSPPVAAAPSSPLDAPEPEAAMYPPRIARTVLWAIGLAGLSALALEVLWTRALVFFLDNSTHAFSSILTAFLLGIGLGSLLISPLIDRGRRLVALLGALQIIIAVSAVVAIPIINGLTPVFQRMVDLSLSSNIQARWAGLRFVTILTVVIVPTLCMGMAFPVASKIYARGPGTVGRALGNVYAVNTLGGVVGSVLAGFVLIPLVGVRTGILMMAGLNALVGVILLQAEPDLRPRTRSAMTAGVAALLLVAALTQTRGPGLVLTSYYEGLETDSILDYREGIGATVKVFRDNYGYRIISINGFPVAGEPPEYQDAQKGLAHLPLLLSTVPEPKMGIVGFGAGGTSWSALQHPVSLVETVELVPDVPRAAGFFPGVNHGVLDEPRFNLVLGDGRNHMLVTDRVYDVISIDATSPKMAGNGSLYSRDFYELLRERSSEAGIVVQWIPHHLISDAEVRMTIRSFQDVFPHTSLWFSPMRQNMVLIGTRQPLEIDYGALTRKLADEGIRGDLLPVNVASAEDLLASFVMGPEKLREYVGDIPANTDNHPYLEFTPAMAYFVGERYRIENHAKFREARESVVPFLVNLGATPESARIAREAVERREEAVGYSLAGDVLLLLGERQRAITEYRRALRIDPTEKNWLNTVLQFDPPGD